ncbi:MAG: 4-(cytidine 5'-diphospho)-2-C-methyl-D-erythritol kinase [Oscillospiraceae bacterium]|nr:4-(cytidine 5'-diphospho)-2-C-methyl-D-erythritol kinase [Oscillospiraceae bacterium]
MLDITGRHGDGYHTLLTIMQSISLADTVTLTPDGSGKITVDCNDSAIPLGMNNIAYKAAEHFYRHTGIESTGLNIKIDKQIPSQAGLGGGSADAAAVLAGMNELYGTKLTADTLCSIGVQLGADVPFCIVGGTKICRGIGELMTDAPPLEKCCIAIGKGAAGISTKEAYAEIDLTGSFCTVDNSGRYDGSISSVKAVGKNAFEDAVRCPDVKTIKESFYSCGAEYSAMSGSGSAVFGIFTELSHAEKACADIKQQGLFAGVYLPVSHGASLLRK